MERVELHCHSKYSKMNGLAYPYDIVKFAEKEGMPAAAITDHGCILGFPEFEWATTIGQCGVKPLFGIEAYNVLVAHNANFYIRFLKAAAIKAGMNYDPAYIDTKMLCRYVYPDCQGYTLNSVCKELKINNDPYCCTGDAAAHGMVFCKTIERLKNEDVDIGSVNNIIEHCPRVFTRSATYHCTVLLKNPKGKKIIYNMISRAEQNKDNINRDVFSLRELCNNRNNLLLGSGCEAGLLFRAIIDDKSEEEIEEIARCFDFIEVQPHMINNFLLESTRYPHIQTEQDLIDINLKLILLGEKLNIPVVATGDVHYLNKEDLLSRNVLRAFHGFVEDDETDLHFRSTKEMLKVFSYLSEDKAKEIVITNTNKIADMCEVISFLPEGKHYPVNEDKSIELRKLCERKLVQTYKDVSSEMIERLDWELKAIHNTNTEFAFIFLHHIIENLGLRPFNVNIQGCAGNIFVCYLLGISDIDPIQYNLSPYFAFGLDQMKEADIDLSFSSKMREKAITDCRQYEGLSSILLASTENCMSEDIAIEAVENYQRERNVIFSEESFKKIICDLQDIYESKCVHPSGIIFVPEDDVLQEFTPIAITEDDQAITYFNYDRLDNRFFKQDILPYFGLDMLEKLEEIVREIPKELTYSEPEIMRLFLDFDGVMGCDDLPEFRCRDSLEILKKAIPKNFDELVKVFALCHGTNVWNDNVGILLEQGKADLSEVISSGDDIYDFLRNKGIEEEAAYLITQQVSKGKWRYDHKKRYLGYMEMLQAAGISEWFIWSCCKIYYLCPQKEQVF